MFYRHLRIGPRSIILHLRIMSGATSSIQSASTNNIAINHEGALLFRLEPGNLQSAKFVEELISLERATFRKNDSWADGEMEQMTKKRNCVVLVARLETDGKLCGYVLGTSTGLNLHVSKIAVRSDCRRNGIARSLMQAVLRTAANQRRSSSSTLHVALDNEPAVRLYRSLGYKEDGLLEDYYTRGRHALKMICDLEPYKGAAEGGAMAGRKR